MSLSGLVEIPRLQAKRKFVMPALRLLRINSGGHPGWCEGMNEAQMDSR